MRCQRFQERKQRNWNPIRIEREDQQQLGKPLHPAAQLQMVLGGDGEDFCGQGTGSSEDGGVFLGVGAGSSGAAVENHQFFHASTLSFTMASTWDSSQQMT